MPRFYLGPYVRTRRPRGFSIAEAALHTVDMLEPPPGSLSSIDLSSRSGASDVGFFILADAAPDPGGNYTLLGQGGTLRDIMPSEQLKRTWGSRINLGPGQKPDGDSLIDILWTSLTIHADPEGIDRVGPLIPGFSGGWEILLNAPAPIQVVPFRLTRPEAAPMIDRMRRDYRRLREQALAGELNGDPNYHRRILKAWGERYRIARPQDVFIPGDLPPEDPLEHSTTLSDNFNRASLGSNWTVVEGAASIVSNELDQDGPASGRLNSGIRHQPVLSTADHFVQILSKPQNPFVWVGPMARMSNVTDYDAYWFYSRQEAGARALGKNTAGGGEATIASDSGGAAGNLTLKLEVVGSSLRSWQNGSLALSGTDATITGNVRGGTGTHLNATLIRFGDDWLAEDVTPPPVGWVPPPGIRRFNRSHLIR